MEKRDVDLKLSNWGPYGKEYVGLSHIADVEKGDRWDCFVMPAFTSRAAIGPYGEIENRWHFWKTAPDYSSYTLRYELEWKDQVYVDVTYEGEGEGRFIHIDCHNKTEHHQNLDLHVVASLTRNQMRPATVDVPDGGYWTSAVDYSDIAFASAPHREKQSCDALKPGEWIQAGAVGLRCVGGSNYFRKAGDRLEYVLDLDEKVEEGVLVFRYHRWSDNTCRMWISAGEVQTEHDLICDGTEMTELRVEIGTIDAGSHVIEFEIVEGAWLLMEGFAVLPGAVADQFKVVPASTDNEASAEYHETGVELSYADCANRYEMSSLSELPVTFRTIAGDDVPAIYSKYANARVHRHFDGLGDRHSVMLSVGPVPFQPGESRRISFKAGLAGESIAEIEPFQGNFDSKQPYAFGMEILAATTFGNTVFPINHRSGYVRHNGPGRFWDSLYTWDSGMIGVGMAAVDLERAKGCLLQYLLPEGDPYAGFVEHGTPLPIQAEVAREIWDQSRDKAWLEEVYPMLRGYYEVIAGRARGSSTDLFQTGLLHTWDYMYNSGGWDDYPPQWALNKDHARRRMITPCVTTSYAIRFAKHLIEFSQALGLDFELYQKDVDRWTKALECAWDAEAGYYSYLEHRSDGSALCIYRHESGENYNRGSDGIIPLITGQLSQERTQVLLDKLFDPKELWTPWGMSTVSQSAAYYSDAGYWNGAVWMPHNWTIWKALREQGLLAESKKLADAVLSCWEREVQTSYNSYELFRVDTGRGSGWHHFSALSTPMLAIYRGEYLSK